MQKLSHLLSGVKPETSINEGEGSTVIDSDKEQAQLQQASSKETDKDLQQKGVSEMDGEATGKTEFEKGSKKEKDKETLQQKAVSEDDIKSQNKKDVEGHEMEDDGVNEKKHDSPNQEAKEQRLESRIANLEKQLDQTADDDDAKKARIKKQLIDMRTKLKMMNESKVDEAVGGAGEISSNNELIAAIEKLIKKGGKQLDKFVASLKAKKLVSESLVVEAVGGAGDNISGNNPIIKAIEKVIKKGGKELKELKKIMLRHKMPIVTEMDGEATGKTEFEKGSKKTKDDEKLQQKGVSEAGKGDDKEYEKFFNDAVKKFGGNDGADSVPANKKKAFFDYIDKNWKSDKEEAGDTSESMDLASGKSNSAGKEVDKQTIKKGLDTDSKAVKDDTKDVDKKKIEQGAVSEAVGGAGDNITSDNELIKAVEKLIKKGGKGLKDLKKMMLRKGMKLVVESDGEATGKTEFEKGSKKTKDDEKLQQKEVSESFMHDPKKLTEYLVTVVADMKKGMAGKNGSNDPKHPDNTKVSKELNAALASLKKVKSGIKDSEGIWMSNKLIKDAQKK